MGTAVTVKGQVTIPKAVRDHLGIKPGSIVEFGLDPDGRVVLSHPAVPRPKSRFTEFMGAAGPGLTTDEVMALTRGETD